jgi:hypothetical protein
LARHPHAQVYCLYQRPNEVPPNEPENKVFKKTKFMFYKERTHAPKPVWIERPEQTSAISESAGIKKERNISLETAKLIAMEWHSGLCSALFAFGSSGVLLPESVGRTLLEINKNLQSANLPKSQLRRLQQLRNFIGGHPSVQQDFEQSQS